MKVLQKTLDSCIDVLDLCIASLQGIVAVYQEEGRDALHIIACQALSLNAIFIAHANPRDSGSRSLPEMLVWIYGYLINLQTCSMILVVKVAEHHDTLGTLSVGKEMEVEQYHLALEVGKIAYHTLVVCQREVDASIYAHLAGINLSLR